MNTGFSPATSSHQFSEPEMIFIPAGEFVMGSDPECDRCSQRRERPQHALYLDDYYIAKMLVTNTQYAAFAGATGHRAPDHWPDGIPPPEKRHHPVVHVSWYDATAFCDWLSQVADKPYGLPSEAEWEKAARGPATGAKQGWIYPWGDQWHSERCNTKENGLGGTTPVGSYPLGASPYGVLDMAGNVFEWTRSLWGKDMKEPQFGYPYDPIDGREDLNAGNGILRVLRGGGFYYDATYARTAYRVRSYPDYRVRTRGFRVCLAAR